MPELEVHDFFNNFSLSIFCNLFKKVKITKIVNYEKSKK